MFKALHRQLCHVQQCHQRGVLLHKIRVQCLVAQSGTTMLAVSSRCSWLYRHDQFFGIIWCNSTVQLTIASCSTVATHDSGSGQYNLLYGSCACAAEVQVP
eukprot:11302-Heterococcus_DN1.PRE.5